MILQKLIVLSVWGPIKLVFDRQWLSSFEVFVSKSFFFVPDDDEEGEETE